MRFNKHKKAKIFAFAFQVNTRRPIGKLTKLLVNRVNRSIF